MITWHNKLPTTFWEAVEDVYGQREWVECGVCVHIALDGWYRTVQEWRHTHTHREREEPNRTKHKHNHSKNAKEIKDISVSFTFTNNVCIFSVYILSSIHKSRKLYSLYLSLLLRHLYARSFGWSVACLRATVVETCYWSWYYELHGSNHIISTHIHTPSIRNTPQKTSTLSIILLSSSKITTLNK